MLLVSLSMLMLLSYCPALVLESLPATNVRIDTSAAYNATEHMNAYQLDPVPLEPPFGAVIAAAQQGEDLSWMMFVEHKYVGPSTVSSVIRC